MSTVSDGSEAFSYDERSQDGSSMTNHFNLPEIHVKDFASGPSQSGSLTGAEQQTAEQSELERIRQWSSQVA